LRVHGGRTLQGKQFLSRKLTVSEHSELGLTPPPENGAVLLAPEKILVAVDDDERAAAKRAAMLGLCEAGRAKLQDLVTSLGVTPQDVSLVVEYGSAEQVIACGARRTQADLVAVGKHGNSWFKELFAGSVTLRLLRMSPADLLVVPPYQNRGPGEQ
jgi:nucleotide-binding universal stress UspA family protein